MMTGTVCNAVDKDNCPYHPIAKPKLTVLEQIAQNNAIRQEAQKAAIRQEWMERSSDWEQYGFQKVNETRRSDDNSDYFSSSKKELAQASEQDKRIFRFYSSNNFRWVNNYLYASSEFPEGTNVDKSIHDLKIKSLASQEVIQAPTQHQAEEAITALDKALLSAQPEARILYRGQSIASAHLSGKTPAEVHAYIDETYKVGHEVSLKGYVSTTPSAVSALGYSSKVDSLGIKVEGLFFEMKTKKGVNITSESLYVREAETLLPRNTKWKVVAVHKSKLVKAESINKRLSTQKKKTQAKVTLIQLVEV